MVEIVNPQDAGLLAEACGSCNQHITVHELRRELVAKEKELARFKDAWKRLPGNGGFKELFVEWEEEDER